MNVVEPSSDNSVLEFKYSLSTFERQALLRVFVNKELDEPNADFYKTALSLLQKIRDRNWWIECDCKPSNNPILYPRKYESSITLVHLNLRGLHTDTCPFKEPEITAKDYLKKQDRSIITGNELLNLHSNIAKEISISKQQQDITVKEAGTSQKRITRLGRALFTLLDKGGLNKISSTKIDLNQQYKNLQSGAADVVLAEDFTLDKILFTHPALVNKAIYTIKEFQSKWPKNSRPYAVMVVVADEVENNTVVCTIKGKRYEVPLHDLGKSSGRLGSKGAPYLVLFTVTTLPENPNWFEPYKGFAVPVFSKSLLCPVESNYERQVLHAIINQWMPHWESKGLSIKINKPLFDLMVKTRDEELLFVRPDFLISSENKKIVLEVMGSHEEEYVQRKKKIVDTMKQKWTVFEFDAYNADVSKQWEQKLQSVFEEITKALLDTSGKSYSSTKRSSFF